MQYTVIADNNGQFVNKLRHPPPFCTAFVSEKDSSAASTELFKIVSSLCLCKVSCSIVDTLRTGQFVCATYMLGVFSEGGPVIAVVFITKRNNSLL
jgi:hypothetical protein